MKNNLISQRPGLVRAAICSVLLAGVGPVQPAASAAQDLQQQDKVLRQIAEDGGARTVGITCKKDEYASFYGTGAVVTADGYILTSTTVVPPGANEIKVVFRGPTIREAEIVEADVQLEATLLKVDAQDLPFFPVARDMPSVGERAYTFGNAHNVMNRGGQAFFSDGLISGIYEVADLGGESMYAGPAVETTAAINPGSDGGPIVNRHGQICAVVSLNISLQRWQGVGVPMPVLLDRLKALKNDKIQLSYDPLIKQPQADSSLTEHAKKVATCLVGIAVEREFPAEVLPRVPWDDYRAEIEGWDKKTVAEKTLAIQIFYQMARLLEVNQQLRRPGGPATGVVIQPDGYILTSAFNVSEDVVFKDQKTNKLRTFDPKAKLEDFVKNASQGLVPAKNPVKSIKVTMADGKTLDAKIVGQHVTLGLALLKVDAKNLKHIDLKKDTGSPQMGQPVGLVGYVGGSHTPFTLNAGIVSAPSRERGFKFQTDALLNYGNTGGPVISEAGELLGIAEAPISLAALPVGGRGIRLRNVMGRIVAARELMAWQIPPNSGVGMVCRADRFDQILDDLKAGKTITGFPGPMLGIVINPVKVYEPQVVVGRVAPDSPAQKAALKPGDKIEAVDGEEITSWKQLTQVLGKHKPGDTVKITVKRKNIGRHLLIKGEKVDSNETLGKLMDKLKPGEKFEGEMVQSDTKVIPIELGGQAP